MADSDPVTQRECAATHTNILGELKKLNGNVAANTKFRVESSMLFRIAALAWASLMAPLTAILVAVLR